MNGKIKLLQRRKQSSSVLRTQKLLARVCLRNWVSLLTPCPLKMNKYSAGKGVCGTEIGKIPLLTTGPLKVEGTHGRHIQITFLDTHSY